MTPATPMCTCPNPVVWHERDCAYLLACAPYGRCSRCNKPLTLPPSMPGVGPAYCGECWQPPTDADFDRALAHGAYDRAVAVGQQPPNPAPAPPRDAPPITESVLVERSLGVWTVTSEDGGIRVQCESEDVADRIAAALTDRSSADASPAALSSSAELIIRYEAEIAKWREAVRAQGTLEHQFKVEIAALRKVAVAARAAHFGLMLDEEEAAHNGPLMEALDEALAAVESTGAGEETR